MNIDRPPLGFQGCFKVVKVAQTNPTMIVLIRESYGCLWGLALALLPLGYQPFIYFQF